jgi:hypothetical protein
MKAAGISKENCGKHTSSKIPNLNGVKILGKTTAVSILKH